MKALLGKLGGRKFIAIILDLIFCILVAVGIDLPNEIKIEIIKWVQVGVGMYLGAQGFADGMSKGATSTTAQVDPEKEPGKKAA
jgi:hypothetical protein